MPSEVYKNTFYSMQSITGISYVLVALRFGKAPQNGPYLTKKTSIDGGQVFGFDIDLYVKEVLLGLEKANSENKTTVEIEEIQIVTDQKPHEGQVALCAYRIAKNYIEEEVTRGRK